MAEQSYSSLLTVHKRVADDNQYASSRMSVSDYVKSKGGNVPISKILIANNGIAAVKCIRSIRKWSYETFGNDRAIEFVALATPEDIKANAQYIHLADEFVAVPGGSNNNNYANIMLIAEIAERCGAHAVWAGWGHASENPKLPEALARTKTKTVWMGPPPEAMRALGDKIGSTIIAQSAGVPCMPWSGDGLTVDYANEGLPKALYAKACVTNANECIAAVDKIGYPVMIKASEGGGGKGIRKVERREDLELAFAQVQGEVPGSPVFLMKLAPECRHLEVQLLADAWGDAIAVYGRDCSIQRRHQKIIEEGPVVAAPPDIWRKMEQSAVRLAKEVGYIGAGTVEYLYIEETKEYYFLELNPRLQVEHPVTELISGVNLPAAQLQVAMGIPLRAIRGIRRMFGAHPDSNTPIDFENTRAQLLPIHVIACRVTAENPDAAFQPTSGVIKELNFRSTPDVWGYFSVAANGGVHEFSDSQFGHMFAQGETREIARRNMSLALKELSIRGDIRTTVEYLRMILETDDFKRNKISTTWLEKVMAKRQVVTEKPQAHLAVIFGALFRAFRTFTGKRKDYLAILERGQLPSKDLFQHLVKYAVDLIYEKTKYIVNITRAGPNLYDISINDWSTSAECHALADDGMLVLLDAKKYVVYGQEFASGLRLTVDGKTCVFHEEYDPSQLRSAMQGKLVRFLVADGAHVTKNAPFAEVEVMKMYITLSAPEDGTIRLLKPEGSILEAGDLLATLVLDHPDKVQKAEVFTGTLPAMKGPHLSGDSPSFHLKDSLSRIQMMLNGYILAPAQLPTVVDTLMNALRAPSLPLDQFREILSTLTGRLPEQLYEELQSIASDYARAIGTHRFHWETPDAFPVIEAQSAIDRCRAGLSEAAAETMDKSLAPINQLLARYKDGNHTHAVTILTSIFNEYFEVEQHFASGEPADQVVKYLRKVFGGSDVERLALAAAAHNRLADRNKLICHLLTVIQDQLNPLVSEFVPVLQRLAVLNAREYASVALKARQLIMRQQVPSSQQRRIAIQTILNAASTSLPEQRADRLMPLIDQSQPIEDMIFTFFEQKKASLRVAAMEAYIRRVYHVYSIQSMNVEIVDNQNRADKDIPSANKDAPTSLLRARFDFYQSNSAMSARAGWMNSARGVEIREKHVAKPGAQGITPSAPSPVNSLSNSSSSNFLMHKVDSFAVIRDQSDSQNNNIGTGSVLAPSSSPDADSLAARVGPMVVKGNTADLVSPIRTGVMVYFPHADFEIIKREIPSIIAELDSALEYSEPVHVLYIALKWVSKMPADDTLSSYLRNFLRPFQDEMTEAGVRRVTFIVTQGREEHPAYFTYRHRLKYDEDTLIRHIEPSYAQHMQLQRMANFDIRFVPTANRMVHLFAAYPTAQPGKGVALPAKDNKPSRTTSSTVATTSIPIPAPPASEEYDGRRFFVRSLIRKLDSAGLDAQIASEELDLDAHPETEVAFIEALNALEIAMAGDNTVWKNNTVFLNTLVETNIDVDYIEAVIRLLARRYADKTVRLNVSTVEFVCSCRNKKPKTNDSKTNNQTNSNANSPTLSNNVSTENTPDNSDTTTTYRFICSNPTGYVLLVDMYQEVREGGRVTLKYLGGRKTADQGIYDGLEPSVPYPVNSHLQKQRQSASAQDTLYCYDFLPVIEQALNKIWTRRLRSKSLRRPSWDDKMTLRDIRQDLIESNSSSLLNGTYSRLKVTELILAKIGSPDSVGISNNEWTLATTNRPYGLNNIGMVAFLLTLLTPEYPSGRDIILIANDITFQAGTFGPLEDTLFDLASKYARSKRLPRLYFAANSGARIGLAEELRNKFQCAWVGDDITKGLAYIYLSPSDFAEFQDCVKCTPLTMSDGSVRHVINDIIGRKDGLGVENLRGSGQIAGETSQAYNDIFTLTYVTGRTVGIGAYLARLGQRVIQKNTPPIILTGYNALNKLLGKNVYTSNVQLGGIEIMYTNGVSHLTVQNDLEGCIASLNWLSYIPSSKNAPLPLLAPLPHIDPVDRTVDFRPTKAPYDPRCILTGVTDDSTNEWVSGLVDRGSFVELLGGWAKGVITGRARLGGIPLSIITVETRQIEQTVPADPAAPESKEQILARAGGVWYPDSAFKTATCIFDSQREGLPLLILANWRGFSGGMRDMFEEVLKFGSYIVDALREYTQPVFVYLPPHSTLRGGAWVVVDPSINSRYMEMYADESARGGVLETEGTLDVKFRKPQVLALAHRLDHVLIKLDAELAGASNGNNSRSVQEIKNDIATRERNIFPLYHQGATLFADLHDTPGRMIAKGCLNGQILWAQARTTLFYRLKRRLAIDQIIKNIIALNPNPTNDDFEWSQASNLVRSWVEKDNKGLWSNDRLLSEWLDEESNQSLIQSNIAQLKLKAASDKVKLLLEGVNSETLLKVLQTLDNEQKNAIKEAARQL